MLIRLAPATAAATLAVLATAAQAQTAPQTPATVSPAEPAAEPAVIPYLPSFFADARPISALDMIRRIPGFSFDSGASVRGLEGGAGNVLIDGQRSLSKSEGLDEILRRIPAASVARIDIIRGGAPGIDMQGRTVMANVVRRSGGGLTGGTQVSIGGLWDGRVVHGARAEVQRRWADRSLEAALVYGEGADDGLGRGERIRTDGAGRLIESADVLGRGRGSHAALTAAYETPLWGGRLRLNTVLQSNPFGVDITDTLRGSGAVEHEHDVIRSHGAEFGARYSRPIAPGLSSETVFLQQLGRDRTVVDFTSPGADREFDLGQRTGESVLHSDLTWTRSNRLTFKFGGEGAFNWLESRTRLLFDGTPILLPAANVRVEELRGEALAEMTWRPTGRLNVEAGLHLEASTIRASGDTDLEKTLFFPKPRLVVTWSPSPAHQLRLRLEREVGQLNFGDFVAASSVANTGTAIAGNPDITPAQSWVVEAVYEYRFWTDGVATLTLAHARTNDVIDRIPLVVGTDVIESPGNIGDGTSTVAGAELTLPLARLGLPGARLRPSVTWRSSRVTDPVTGLRRPASGARHIGWEAHFNQDLPAWRANWGVDAYGGFSDTTYGVSEIGRYSVHPYVGLFAEYKPRPNLLFRLELQNLTGRDTVYTRRVFDGTRATGPLVLVDSRELHPGPIALFRARRTF